jgi:hypothetical protein
MMWDATCPFPSFARQICSRIYFCTYLQGLAVPSWQSVFATSSGGVMAIYEAADALEKVCGGPMGLRILQRLVMSGLNARDLLMSCIRAISSGQPHIAAARAGQPDQWWQEWRLNCKRCD